MNILFVGERTEGYFIEEVIKPEGEMIYVKENYHIKEQKIDILKAIENNNPDYMVVDVNQYIDDGVVIIDTIDKIKIAKNIKTILIVSSISEKNVVVKESIDRNIKSFIPSYLNMTDKKEEFVNLTHGLYGKNSETPQVKQVEEKLNKKKTELQNLKTIGVVGASKRVGTTTQCLQIIKYLNYKGYKACYVESNSKTYLNISDVRKDKNLTFIDLLESLTFGEHTFNKKTNILQYNGIDILMDKVSLNDKVKKKYDFFIFDYGSFDDNDFNKMSFLKDDIQFIVGGGFMTELNYTLQLASNVSYKDANILINFINNKKDKEEALECLDVQTEIFNNKERTHFVDYFESPFTLSNIELYDKVLGIKQKEDPNQETKKKRKLLFRRKS